MNLLCPVCEEYLLAPTFIHEGREYHTACLGSEHHARADAGAQAQREPTGSVVEDDEDF